MPAPRAPRPVTTPEGLRRLAAKDPAAALANPGLPLVLLAQPDWFARLPEPLLLSLLSVAEPANPVLLAAAMAHARPAVRAAAAGHPALRPDHLTALLRDPDPAVREAAYQHPGASLPPAEVPAASRATLQSGLPTRAEAFEPMWDVRRLVSQPGGWPLAGIAWVLAVPYQPINEGNILKPLVARLAADPAFRAAAEAAVLAPAATGAPVAAAPPLLRAALAAQPAAAAPLLAALATDDQPAVREAVARNPGAPPDLLAQLAADVTAAVRTAVAANPATPPAALHQLAADAELHPRIAVARNPSTPPDLLTQLAADPAPDVAQYLPRNPAASPALLAQLAAHPSRRVRSYLLENDVTLPTELLPLLLHNDMPEIAAKAQRLLARPDLDAALLHQAATSADYRQRLEVAHNPALPPALVARLLADSSQQVRAAAAWRADLTLTQALALATDVPAVQQTLVRNPAAPPAALALLTASPDWHVRILLAQHPAAPPATLLTLRHDSHAAVAEKALLHPSFPPSELLRLATEGTRPERLEVSHHPAAPAAALGRLATDPDPAIRANVARHPAAPPEAVARLATDPEAKVQQAWIYHHQPLLPGTIELLRRVLPASRELRLLLQLGHPELLTAADRAALAASAHPADRLSVAALPEFREALAHDPHLLVRLAAGQV